MKLTTKSFDHNSLMPSKFAFGKFDATSHVALSENLNPHLKWENVPNDAKSFVIVCHDPDVPTKPDDVNQAGRTVPYDLPRADFYHWILVDVPINRREIQEGEFSDKIVARGKSGPETCGGMRQGLNNYTEWFAADTSMAGQYFGYDGPCPPWNDERMHHYHFTVFALDIERCPVVGNFTGNQVKEAIRGHVLAEAQITATYAIYPEAKP